VPHETTSDSVVSCSGFAALRLRPAASRERRRLVAVAAAAAPSGVLHGKAPPFSARRDSLAARPTKASEAAAANRRFAPPPVASAQITPLGPSRFTRGEADESERSGGREPQVRPAASRERSNHASRPPRIHSEGSRPERAKAKRVASAQMRALKSRDSIVVPRPRRRWGTSACASRL